jgi:hypothetical protein
MSWLSPLQGDHHEGRHVNMDPIWQWSLWPNGFKEAMGARLWDNLGPHLAEGVYVNELQDESRDRIRAT